jgi:microcystin-dependent protein
VPGQTPNLQLPYPTAGDTVDVPRDIKALADKVDPLGVVAVGSIVMWMAAAAPAGWLLMQGQTNLSAATYPGLAAIFGQSGGNIVMPDMRGRFPVGGGAGGGDNYAVGVKGGANPVAITTGNMPTHNHTGFSDFADRSLVHAHRPPNGAYPFAYATQTASAAAGNQYAAVGYFEGTTALDAAPDHKHAIANSGLGLPLDARPPYLAVNFIVRAG